MGKRCVCVGACVVAVEGGAQHGGRPGHPGVLARWPTLGWQRTASCFSCSFGAGGGSAAFASACFNCSRVPSLPQETKIELIKTLQTLTEGKVRRSGGLPGLQEAGCRRLAAGG